MKTGLNPRQITGTPYAPWKGRRWNVKTYLWIFPALVVVSLFTIYPVIYSVDTALHRNLLTRPDQNQFVGLENFEQILTNPAMHRSLFATLQFLSWAVIGTVVFSVLVALLLNQRFGGAKVAQVLILIPWAVPAVMAGIIWRWMFAGNVGVINGALYAVGLIDSYYSFMGDPLTAKLAVLTARLWKDIPLAAILLLAALQLIPRDLYDAVKVDGGNIWSEFRHVTFPFLKPTLVVVMVLETMISFATFDLIFAMSGGGPADATTFLAWFAYKEIFVSLNLGTGAAMAFAIGALTLVVALAYIIALRTTEIYSK